MELVGFVLAGGASVRMGRSKALLPYPGDRPMVQVIADELAPLCASVSVVVKSRTDVSQWPSGLAILVEPPDLPRHPLSGIVTALSTLSPGALALVLPCDVPFIRQTALNRLVASMRGVETGVVAQTEDRLHPLVGVFPAAALLRAQKCLTERRSVTHFVATMSRVMLPEDQLRNINRPDDLGG
jgi:molybdopterin-guanine dinucleotide biosynthesis protein A